MATRSVGLRRALSGLAVTLACLLGFGAKQPAEATMDEMSFRLVPIGNAASCGESCPMAIAATGQITEATPARFLTFIASTARQADLHTVVFMNSPGGRVLASMEFGDELRRLGAAAVVAGVYPDGRGGSVVTNAECFSACVYALMGARKRVVPPSSQVGIHRMFAYAASMEAPDRVERQYDDGDMRSVLMAYSARMGVSPALIEAAEHIPSDKLHILTRGEIRRWHLGVPRL